MDKFRLLLITSVLGGLIYLIVIYNPDQGVVDEAYIASDSYQQMKEKMRTENEDRFTPRQKVRSILERVVKSKDSPEVRFPMNDLTALSSGNDHSWDVMYNFRFRKLGRYRQGAIEAHFVLMQKPDTYHESGLLMVTSRDDSLLYILTVGQFKNTVAETIETRIDLRDDGLISSIVSTKRVYPVEQRNTDTHLYQVLESGKINRLGS